MRRNRSEKCEKENPDQELHRLIIYSECQRPNLEGRKYKTTKGVESRLSAQATTVSQLSNEQAQSFKQVLVASLRRPTIEAISIPDVYDFLDWNYESAHLSSGCAILYAYHFLFMLMLTMAIDTLRPNTLLSPKATQSEFQRNGPSDHVLPARLFIFLALIHAVWVT